MSSHSHDHEHDDGHSHGLGAYRGADRRALLVAALLTGGFMVAEAVGGVVTGSLALLADAGHMLSDSFSLALALFAVTIAARPATSKRTFGYKRAEILAALVNGILLVLVSVWVVYEAIGRLNDPVEILGGGMLAIAVLGLLINVAAFLVLWKGGGESLNVKAALRHVLGDLLGSVGVILAAGVILLTGWSPIDPIVSILISLLIAASAWSVLKESVDVLLESAPVDIDTDEVGKAMAGMAGVEQVHDLHIWQITSGFPALSAHILVGREDDCHTIRRDVDSLLKEHYDIEHATLQVEHVPGPELIALDTPDGGKS
ncbi:MAG: cation transporter [Solirubrobacterales bacterium]|nr:cation transporter [Solirubrobacterales bacterium]OJU93377.1 MAG: cation transporter [Solirubrobacterales bacterium 67-14]